MYKKSKRKIHFSYHTHHDTPSLNDLLPKLYQEYIEHLVRNGHDWARNEKSKMLVKHKSAFACTLINCYQIDYGRLTYSRSSNEYKAFPFTFKILDSVLSWLKAEAYISNKIGSYDFKLGRGTLSSIRCRKKLHSLFGRA